MGGIYVDSILLFFDSCFLPRHLGIFKYSREFGSEWERHSGCTGR